MRRLIAALLALVLALTLVGCGESAAANGGEDVWSGVDLTEEEDDANGDETSPYLRLYCPADIGAKNKSAGGGDAITGIPIRWEQITGDDRGRQQQAQYIMELLLGGCTEPDFTSPMPEGTRVLSCTVTGGTVAVDLSNEYDQLAGVERTIADYCITLSMMQLAGILAVRITVEGRVSADHPAEVYTSEEVLLTSPEDIVRTVKVQLYFPNATGELVGEERRLTVYEGETVAQAVVKALTERPMARYADLEPLLPEGFTALSASVEGGTCFLNVSGSVAALLPESSTEQARMIQGLVDSLCSMDEVSQVQLMVDGEYQLMLGRVPISRPLLPSGTDGGQTT